MFKAIFKEISLYIKRNFLAFFISILYTTLGTIVVFNMYPDNPLNDANWYKWSWLITLPVNIISFCYRYTGGKEYLTIFIIQTVMFIVSFAVFSKVFMKIKKSVYKDKS